MRSDLYIGNTKINNEALQVTAHIKAITKRSLEIVPFILTPDTTGVLDGVFIDLIFYNRVNEVGDKLTSLIYLGDFRNSTSRRKVVYTTDKLFRNTSVELETGITNQDVDFSGYNYVDPHGVLPLYEESLDSTVLDKSGKVANTLGALNIAFDGWYTFATVSLRPATNSSVLNDLVYRDPEETAAYQCISSSPSTENDDHWVSTKSFSNNELKIGSFLELNNISNSYASFDFFVVYDFKQLYNKTLKDEKIIPRYVDNNRIVQLGKSMKENLINKDLQSAQMLLQTVEDSVQINGLG